MKTTQAMCILGGVLLLAVALAYVCAHGLPGDPTLIEQTIPPPIPTDQIIDQPPKPEPPVAPDEPTPVDVPPVAPPAASPSQAAPNSCQGGACAPRRYQAPPRRRGFFQRLFGR